MPKLIDEAHLHATAEFKELTPEIQEAYKNYHRAVFADGALDKKTKELIAFAVGSAIQCEYCVETHSEKALAYGATKKELNEALHVAVAINAGATISHGLRAYKKEETGKKL
ncbi:MAG: carboxymuconolactone decarboxylase family protein [Candidatus Diapherotrites archaeon]|nr:carboxymuconolactone decarboxylase family protein [Candidatus Diapherotrites archaeon]